MYEKDLKFQVNIEQVEQSEYKKLMKYRPDWIGTENDHPFGACHEDWEEMKSEMLETDELWYFDTDPATWACLCGRRGYAVVRDGKVIDALSVEMS
jgi:O-methyltransferase involved in polyketide biosynthesis